MSHQQNRSQDKCSSPVNMNDIELSATVNILGNEDDAIVPSLAHYDVSTEQATEEMLFDFENKSIVPYYDVNAEQATEEMLFDFETIHTTFIENMANIKCAPLEFHNGDPPKTMYFTNVFNDKDDTYPPTSSPIQVEMDGSYTFVGVQRFILKLPGLQY